MPRIKIETFLQLERSKAHQLMNVTMDAVVAVLELIPDDRTISFTVHERDFFTMKPPYEIFIEIALFRGRSHLKKKQLYQTIVQRLFEKCGIEKDRILIMLNEQPRENWGLRGGVPGDEISFDYRIEV